MQSAPRTDLRTVHMRYRQILNCLKTKTFCTGQLCLQVHQQTTAIHTGFLSTLLRKLRTHLLTSKLLIRNRMPQIMRSLYRRRKKRLPKKPQMQSCKMDTTFLSHMTRTEESLITGQIKIQLSTMSQTDMSPKLTTYRTTVKKRVHMQQNSREQMLYRLKGLKNCM